MENSITLDENGSTGYTWKHEVIEGEVEVIKKSAYPNSQDENGDFRVGGGGKVTFIFTGKGKVKLTLGRSWENDPVRTIDIEV